MEMWQAHLGHEATVDEFLKSINDTPEMADIYESGKYTFWQC